VHVLDDQHHRAGLGQALQQDEQLLEQPGPRFARVLRPGGLTELRQQPGQLPGRAARQQLGHPSSAQIPDEFAEHRGERDERQAISAKLQATTHQHPHARTARPLSEFGYQPGLSHPGLPANHNVGRAAVGHLCQGGIQRGKLAGPADQNRTPTPENPRQQACQLQENLRNHVTASDSH
jgi:hypothetical protein